MGFLDIVSVTGFRNIHMRFYTRAFLRVKIAVQIFIPTSKNRSCDVYEKAVGFEDSAV